MQSIHFPKFVSVTDSEVATDTFWERNFGDDEEIAWFRFEKEFLTEYDAQLQGDISILFLMVPIIDPFI